MKHSLMIWLLIFSLALAACPSLSVRAEENQTDADDPVSLTSEAAILMETKTGTILYEKNAEVQRCPASITKIMTLLLIYDAISDGRISLEDQVTTSAYAKSMGGSQVFLEEGEIQTVETLIKCIVVASGNDASVAMAEYIAGSEEAFVAMMNEKAAKLGMTGTHFVDCCGLTDSDEHYTTAKDVALMARALIGQYPQISEYATIWMENITHVTQKGSSEFGLSNTNKLLKMTNDFEVTGLKTGSTSKAGYCFCATARKDNIDLIAVIMDAPDYKVRFSEAQKLLNYGYGNCSYYEDTTPPVLEDITVLKGTADTVSLEYADTFSYVSFKNDDMSEITSELHIDEMIAAPFEKGTKAGYIEYFSGDSSIGTVEILTSSAMLQAGFTDYLLKIYDDFMSIAG